MDSTIGPIDCLYFSLITSATVGFGDITSTDRVTVMIQVLLSFVFATVIISHFLSNDFQVKKKQ